VIHYQQEDETELVIRVLSFGPFVRVAEPDHFVNLIRERLVSQKGLFIS
jgi:predicted DNA-binding transcriptional regulator YafY